MIYAVCVTMYGQNNFLNYFQIEVYELPSSKLSLLGGTPYYMEAWYSRGTVQVGVDMFDVPVAAGQIEGAVNEKQCIVIGSTVHPEIQVQILSIIMSLIKLENAYFRL